MGMIVLFASAVILTMGFIMLFEPLTRHIGLVDYPGGRKDHRQPTSLVGGIAVLCTFLMTTLKFDIPQNYGPSFLLAGAIIFIVGMLDDVRELSAFIRIIVQITASLIIIIWGGAELQNLGAIFGGSDVMLGMLAIPFTVFCCVGLVNAVNLMDGIDGLAGTSLLLIFSILLFLAWNAGLIQEINVLLIVCGMLIGFLVFNFRFLDSQPARIFMGDEGALFLGLTVTWFLIRFTQEPINLLRPITAVWLFALPIMDTLTVMGRRLMLRRSPFSADREHFHHMLLKAGFSVRSTVLIILGLNVLLSAIGLFSERADVSEAVMFYSFSGLFIAYFWGMDHRWKAIKALGDEHAAKQWAPKKRKSSDV